MTVTMIIADPNWSEVTKDNPCDICGKDHWCTRCNRIVHCRRMASHPTYLDGVHQQDKAGVDYWRYWLDGRPQVRTLPVPTVQPSTKKADPDTLHEVYSRLLELVGEPTDEQREKLRQRNLTDAQVDQLIKDAPYAWLPIRGRAKICTQLINEGFETDLARTPGSMSSRAMMVRRFGPLPALPE